jgi:hypothetical protein
MRTVLALVAAALGLLLLLPLLLLTLPLLFVALSTRGLARLFEPAYLTQEQLIEFDPAIGWKPRPNLDTHHLMADLFRISTDADGWRGRSTLAESEIVVFGDSFAAGYGVDDDELFANLLVSPRIKPIGIGGYSMVQELLWMKTLAPALYGKLVVWFIYLGNDLYDNLAPDLRGYRKPFVREARRNVWEISAHHVRPEKWPITPRVGHGRIHMYKLAELCSATYLADRAYRACEFLIAEGRRVTTDAGADLVVLTIPEPMQLTGEGCRKLTSLVPGLQGFDPDLPDKRIESACRRLNVPFVAGTQVLDISCYKDNDCHWNLAGHRRIARVLRDVHASRRDPRMWQQERSGTAVIPTDLSAAGKAASR